MRKLDNIIKKNKDYVDPYRQHCNEEFSSQGRTTRTEIDKPGQNPGLCLSFRLPASPRGPKLFVGIALFLPDNHYIIFSLFDNHSIFFSLLDNHYIFFA